MVAIRRAKPEAEAQKLNQIAGWLGVDKIVTHWQVAGHLTWIASH
jgi:hypothetical protein